ncbi:hypothetical protein PENSOL_c148G04064 [Penicillium solitum]|uniref:Cytochrome P450 n=1 Tax=Penicillium solitum TaxID=60172 RepID=A0A1V6Q2Z5_9EURO|nr:uncharacterized protein PENSOL_c148G04064 [Penicillium solitum]OQD83650.1 hypothetical protein PENSOL_c148G04064 [Penicillium solitum]
MRISPNEVSFDDIEASDIIYAQTSKFEKSEYYYRAFEDQGPNLFSIRDRQHHSQAKRLVSHAFSRANVIQHESSIYDKALYLMDRIEQRAKERRTIPLFPAFRCMTLDTISEFCFGKSTGALHMNNFESTTFEAIDKANGAVLFFQYFPFLRHLIQWANNYKICAVPNGFIELAQKAEAGLQDVHSSGSWTMFKNMISMAEKKSTQLTKEQLVSEGMLMIVAGTDTTATSLSVTLHNLLQQPETYKKLQDEIRTVMPTMDSRPTIQVLDTLPFLDACVKEGLRLACPSHTRLPRTVPSDGWYFKGHYFPYRTNVSTSPLYYLHSDNVFHSPKKYNPFRWLVDDEKRRHLLANFHPFSRGTRQCIGQNLSSVEQKIVLSLFIRRFNPGTVLKKKVSLIEAVTAVPDDPLEVLVNLIFE